MEMHMDVWENKATLNSSSMDEFAVPQDSEKELREQRLHMERIFGVVLNILGVLNQTHMLEQSAGHQQMWIQLQGEKRNIEKAKSYIKGLCTPDITEDTTYPRGLYCIFVGAKGIFLDCLIRATSACIKPLSPGCIRISGLAEEAVMAQSRVQAFLEGSNSCYRPDDDAQIKRDFKDLVEEHTDIHVLDLLILSTSVKEQLLALVHEANISGLHKRRVIHSKNNLFEKPTEIAVHSHSNFPTSVPLQNPPTLEKMLSSKPMEITKPGSERRILHHRASNPHQLKVDKTWDYNNRAALFQRQNTKEKPVGLVQDIEYNQKEEKSREIACTDDEEFREISGLLGTIMGRDEGEQGSNTNFSLGTEKEFSMLLDFFKTMGYKEAVVLKVLSENGIQEPSQILDKVNLEESNHCQGKLESNRFTLLNESSDTYGNNEDSYVWEVVKSAAKNCGYSPSEIVDKGDGSVAGLLRKLNEKNTNPEHHMNISEVHRYPNQESTRQEKVSCIQPRTELNVSQPDVGMSEMGRHKTMFSNCPVEDHFPGSAAQETCDIKVAKYLESEDGLSAPVVTGAQRFNEAMQTPFELNLRNEPGNEQLRHIIVDGSNVAMISLQLSSPEASSLHKGCSQLGSLLFSQPVTEAEHTHRSVILGTFLQLYHLLGVSDTLSGLCIFYTVLQLHKIYLKKQLLFCIMHPNLNYIIQLLKGYSIKIKLLLFRYSMPF
ncbi:NEDD4-binding protein 1 isoform X2 [Bombina bombina]|uniref:NEDD4-binding protein 1 isoform X2 n=1 Tax=Bombina bombina TaxID=8345 RepID=UPI00235AC097|nr:NEDD4-binding protein 1 isoform X2 [Bombina bombina]